jgi:hypothetical protein
VRAGNARPSGHPLDVNPPGQSRSFTPKVRFGAAHPSSIAPPGSSELSASCVEKTTRARQLRPATAVQPCGETPF